VGGAFESKEEEMAGGWGQLHTEELHSVKIKGEIIPVMGRGGPQDCETPRLPNFLDNRFTDGGDVVSLTRRPPFTPGKFLVFISVRS
jgi:hypothetical protein